MTKALATLLVGFFLAGAVTFGAVGPVAAQDFHFVKHVDKPSPML